MWCWRVRLSGLPSYSEATKQPQRQAEPGCQSAEAFERISCPWCAHAFCNGNLVHCSSTTLYLAVYSSVFGCCLQSTEQCILREMTLFGCACLVRQWIRGLCQYLALDEFHTISTFTSTRILKYFSLFSRRMGNWCAART